MLSQTKAQELALFANDIRTECIKMIGSLGVGHVGGSFSIADVLACLYGGIMKVDPNNPRWDERDKFVLSKGHAGPALYAALALRGFFPMDYLETLNRPGTKLPSHVDRNLTPGVDMTAGSLGQGISAAVGMALANQIQGRNSYVYSLIGDGESEEGQVWEAIMFAAAKKLDHFILFVDFNGHQLDSYVSEISGISEYKTKFEAFGWNAIDVENGNNVEDIYEAILQAQQAIDRPTAIILHTVKGKGWKFAEENRMKNHNPTVSPQQLEEILSQLSIRRQEIMGGNE